MVAREGRVSGGGLYDIWKLERRAWLEGPQAIGDFVRDDAIVLPPHPMPMTTYAGICRSAERAAPFREVEFSDRQFLQDGDTVIIAYHASARHQRYRRRYEARCCTTYRRTDTGWEVCAHSHARV